MAEGWALSTGNLPRGGLSRNSVDRITDRPDTTSAFDRGHKALTQQQHLPLIPVSVLNAVPMLIWLDIKRDAYVKRNMLLLCFVRLGKSLCHHLEEVLYFT